MFVGEVNKELGGDFSIETYLDVKLKNIAVYI